MAYDEKLAGRIRALLKGKRGIAEKKMFGGVAFLAKGKMCCGVLNAELVARVGAEEYGSALKLRGTRPMDFTGRALTGFVYVAPAAIHSGRDLRRWVERCLNFAGSQGTLK